MAKKPMFPRPHLTYRLDVNAINYHCRVLGLNRDALGFKAKMDGLHPQVSGTLLVSIATALGVRPEEITCGCIVPSWNSMIGFYRQGTTEADREAEKKDQDRMRRASIRDMNRRPDLAVGLCEKALDHIDPVQEPLLHAKVRVRLIEFLDNAGQLSEARRRVRRLLMDLEAQALGEEGEEIKVCAKLALGRLLHRAKRFEESKALLEEIRKAYGPPYELSALHQIAVAELEEYKVTDPADQARRAALLDSAERHFGEVIEAWGELSLTYREGFARRRLAQILRIRGKLAEAQSQYAAAIKAFAYFRCERYSEDTQKELDALLEEKRAKDAEYLAELERGYEAKLAEAQCIIDELRRRLGES
jgi:hypothetical protein